MPYLRFSRDKRGYENTYVVHSDKRRGKTRSRILYWFRTPPGVKVGRAALDDDAIRRIQELNPFIAFDWPRILKGQDAPPSEPRVPVEVRRQRGSPRPQERPERREARPPVEPPRSDFADFKEVLQTEPTPVPPEPPTPAVPDVIVAAHAKLGAEGVARLRARYVEIVARIRERVSDPVRREELQAQADRLSPDSWIADADVVRALDEYESVFASLREVVGRKRRRRRRGSRTTGSSDEREVGSPDDREAEGSDDRESSDDWVSTSGEPASSEHPSSGPSELPGSQTAGHADTSESREEPEDPGL